MLKALEQKRVISLSDEILTTGHSPLKVIAEDNETYFVKNYEGKLPAYYLCSEIICHYLLTLWKIPTPEIVLLEVDAQSFKEKLLTFTNRHKLSYYYLPAVGSLLIVGQVIEMNSLTEPNIKLNPNQLENIEDVWKIGLFDIWVENDDRKPTNPNLLLQQAQVTKRKIFALDHAFCFSSLPYKDLNPDYGITQGFNDNILYTNLAKDLFQQYQGDEEFRSVVSQFFEESINKSRDSFEDLISFIPEKYHLDSEDKETIYKFLFDKNRNQQVLDYFFEHIEDYA